jgi:hypothetical protein
LKQQRPAGAPAQAAAAAAARACCEAAACRRVAAVTPARRSARIFVCGARGAARRGAS